MCFLASLLISCGLGMRCLAVVKIVKGFVVAKVVVVFSLHTVEWNLIGSVTAILL